VAEQYQVKYTPSLTAEIGAKSVSLGPNT
jgi:hypothetical protein